RKFLQNRSGRLSAPRSKLPRSYSCLCFPFICSSHAMSNGPADGDAFCPAASREPKAARLVTDAIAVRNDRRPDTSLIALSFTTSPALPAPPALLNAGLQVCVVDRVRRQLF